MFNAWEEQQQRNRTLVEQSACMRAEVESAVLPFRLDVGAGTGLGPDEALVLRAIQTEAARVALRTLASLARIHELDHLGGALDLIPAFALTMAVTDHERIRYTFEHAHTSIGHYATLAVWGYLEAGQVIEGFRRSLDIPGHTAWVPGGTELNGGRLGVMIPAAVGQALGMRAEYGPEAWVICHCGDAGWISGQALNGFNAAHVHRAPVTFIMHRNGIQLSGTNRRILDKDPRPIIRSLGIEIIEVPCLWDVEQLYEAYCQASRLARVGRPSLIYPVGFHSTPGRTVTLETFGGMFGIGDAVRRFADQHKVPINREIWIPGSLMSFRDVHPMLECLFYVNDLPGGEGHHDGHMKGRSLDEVLANPMFGEPAEQVKAWERVRAQAPRKVITRARPAPGALNLALSDDAVRGIELPAAGTSASPRVGVERGYAAVAKAFPDRVFVVSCDLDPSTKLQKARSFLAPDHQFEMSIEEQASALMANGLAVASRRPTLVVFSTFAAFFEGIAREGFEMWRYQRNLTGANEGLNVTFHLSHVGACTGRDHFSGWGLDWINLALGYLPYLHRFYAPADARAAFLAVRDLAAHYGGHIIGIPRDNLPVLARQDSSDPLWTPEAPWTAVTPYRVHPGARRAILALGAPAFLAGEAADRLSREGTPVDAHIINGLPLPEGWLDGLPARYPDGLVTVEDGLIDDPRFGLRGFAGAVRAALGPSGVPLDHVGIVDPRIAPSHGFAETWAHFGITIDALIAALKNGS
jgi:transketolase N-terminal domain/subunit/transketolase C-terminal domain/subunit